MDEPVPVLEPVVPQRRRRIGLAVAVLALLAVGVAGLWGLFTVVRDAQPLGGGAPRLVVVETDGGIATTDGGDETLHVRDVPGYRLPVPGLVARRDAGRRDRTIRRLRHRRRVRRRPGGRRRTDDDLQERRAPGLLPVLGPGQPPRDLPDERAEPGRHRAAHRAGRRERPLPRSSGRPPRSTGTSSTPRDSSSTRGALARRRSSARWTSTGDSLEDAAIRSGLFRAPAIGGDGASRAYVTAASDDPADGDQLVVEARDGSIRQEIPVEGPPRSRFDPTSTTLAFIAPNARHGSSAADPVRAAPDRRRQPPATCERCSTATCSHSSGRPTGGRSRRSTFARRTMCPGPGEARCVGGSACLRGFGATAAALPPFAAATPGVGLHLSFIDAASRRDPLRARYSRVSDLFAFQVVPYFDQYAPSHRFWAAGQQLDRAADCR